jgi:FdrA protein
MITKGILKKGEYFDSVSLMMVAKKINELDGVVDSAVIMGTKENKSILEASGLLLTEFDKTDDTDLLIAIKAETEVIVDQVLRKIDDQLQQLRARDETAEQYTPKSIDGALKLLPDANLALISVPGKYAETQAMKALQHGLHVMIFSDNVPIGQEIELKTYAKEKGLLVMGPDCGTVVINGIPLAFANVVNRGDIGIVAASGTGLQEVSSIISNQGAGISQAIGTGSRDVTKEVGGIMFIESVKRLLMDKNTNVILLVSKPPRHEVLKKIGAVLKGNKKPIVSVFLDADANLIKSYGVIPASTLEEGALIAATLSIGENIDDVTKTIMSRDFKLKIIANSEAKKLKNGQKYLRALFSGGTFCSEAQVLSHSVLKEVYSNAPVGNSLQLKNSWNSEKNTIVDLGADEFTVGRPHPMIDYSIRTKRIIDEANDPETAVMLLDVVLGYGSHKNPLAEIVPVIEKAKNIARSNGRYLPVICSVTGTDKDPQNRTRIVNGLKQAGTLVMESNAAACNLARYIIEKIA